MARLRKSRTALLIIDVQQELFNKSTPIYRAESLLTTINALIERAHSARALVVFVQHNDQRALVKGSGGWQLHPQILQRAPVHVVDKHHGNAFEDTSLDNLLKSNDVNHVVVTGLVTHGCVKATCLGSSAAGYEVTLVSDGHSSYSKEADSLVTEWNQKLSEQGVLVRPGVEITFD